MYQSLISSEQLSQTKAIIIDCRFSLADVNYGRISFREGHILGAVYAHLDEDLSGEIIPGVTGRHPLPEKNDLVSLFSDWGIDSGSQVVCYDDFHGGIASRLWWLLRWAGHENVAVLDGGWKAWIENGFESSRAITPTKNTSFNANFNDNMFVLMNRLDEFNKNGYQILDARASFRYSGEKEPIDPVAGHIPGAINLPFLDNLKDSHWKSEVEIRNRFVNLPQKTIMYCGSGVTACHNILAQKVAGIKESILYPGSWSEWITIPENGIELGE